MSNSKEGHRRIDEFGRKLSANSYNVPISNVKVSGLSTSDGICINNLQGRYGEVLSIKKL